MQFYYIILVFFSLFQRSAIVKNAQFVGEKVISRVFTLYQQNNVTLPPQLQKAQMDFRQIK
jgi:hypothetical protein